MQTETVAKPKMNVAVVGVGYWGRNLVRNFHALGALAALCDGNKSVEDNCKHEYKDVKFYCEFGRVLSDPTIHAIALATPAVAHYEMAKAAIEAGKDVGPCGVSRPGRVEDHGPDCGMKGGKVRGVARGGRDFSSRSGDRLRHLLDVPRHPRAGSQGDVRPGGDRAPVRDAVA